MRANFERLKSILTSKQTILLNQLMGNIYPTSSYSGISRTYCLYISCLKQDDFLCCCCCLSVCVFILSFEKLTDLKKITKQLSGKNEGNGAIRYIRTVLSLNLRYKKKKKKKRKRPRSAYNLLIPTSLLNAASSSSSPSQVFFLLLLG